MTRIFAGLFVALGVLQVGCGSTASIPGNSDQGKLDDSGTPTGPVMDASVTTPVDATTGTPPPPPPGPDGSVAPPVDAGKVQDASTTTPRPDAQGTGGAMDASTGGARDAGGPPPPPPPPPPPVDGGCGGVAFGNGPINMSATHLDIGVHDPSMIWDGNNYYLFATGGSLGGGSSPLGFKSSADILTWARATQIFTADPAFVAQTIGSAPSTLWAADVSYWNGLFHVYYAGSTFGSNDSVIGLVTSPSLSSPQWTDQGMVIASKTSDNFNAIDPNLAFDQSCQPWLAYGSFWDGIKMRKIDPTTGLLATDNTTTYSLASRGGGAIEASSIISHNGFYYLFVSFDLCCKGVNSTYRTMMGRATSITGPYTNKAGADMMTGAAEQLLITEGRYIGPGGGTAWRDGNNYLYVYHYYDGDANGASKLQIRPITFDATDWVILGDPLFP